MTDTPLVTRSGSLPVLALETLQFSWGGLWDGRLADGLVHLVRNTGRGTPGPTLCGVDRFAKDGPGFSVGGGISGPGIALAACGGCVESALREFPMLPIRGGDPFRRVVLEAIHG